MSAALFLWPGGVSLLQRVSGAANIVVHSLLAIGDCVHALFWQHPGMKHKEYSQLCI